LAFATLAPLSDSRHALFAGRHLLFWLRGHGPCPGHGPRQVFSTVRA